MDTGTHVVMGFAIGGLATLDPVVAESAVTSQSVLIGAIIGSQIPDIDTVLKLRNNAVYIRNHRGITHSIPAVLIWPLLILAVLYPFYPEANLLHLWIWTFLAVFLHVFVDIFNAYGTQAIRPFSSKWVALGVINTFDPIIFGIHVVGLILWGLGFDPGPTFLYMYMIIILYYILRFFVQHAVKSAVKKKIPDAEKIIVSSTLHFYQWRLAIVSKEFFYVARAYGSSITFFEKYKRIPVPDNPVINAAKKDKNLSAFLSFSPVYRWEIEDFEDDGYEVRFIDLRYRSNGHYPFVAVVKLNEDLDIESSYTGWIYSEEKLRKKLEIIPD
ncbi:metal-dependent hydrolase [Rossellomorea vietnamensis]|uniref:Metal-dependent hydrolase n=1 Tax=Rossellomorea aquimaris TaxID=189382 RepID=A0A5D4U159_9BACI|nr:metal-dependent hydrolase [Rossellomorea aquimaris]TYS81045.1 metal-dependent hydrolase [Rossellomorea aquimaris]